MMSIVHQWRLSYLGTSWFVVNIDLNKINLSRFLSWFAEANPFSYGGLIFWELCGHLDIYRYWKFYCPGPGGLNGCIFKSFVPFSSKRIKFIQSIHTFLVMKLSGQVPHNNLRTRVRDPLPREKQLGIIRCEHDIGWQHLSQKKRELVLIFSLHFKIQPAEYGSNAATYLQADQVRF